jgi:plastocyanin
LTVRARRGGWAAVLLAGAAGVGPLLWVTAGPAWAFTAPVKISERAGSNDEFEFAPTVVTIDVDDKVLWTNKSGSRHTVTSDAGSVRFDSGQIPAGGQWERRFTTPGTFTYHCEVHPDMVGRIEVGPPASTTTAPPPPTTTTAPPTTTTTAPTPTTTEPPTTTTTAQRPAAGQPLPPVPSSAAAPPPTLATSSTTTAPPSSTTTTTAAPPTTVTTAPPTLPGEGVAGPPPPAEAPPTTAAPDTGDELPTAAGPIRSNGGDLDAGAVAMVSALVAVGAFAAWTLIRVRPGRV